MHGMDDRFPPLPTPPDDAPPQRSSPSRGAPVPSGWRVNSGAGQARKKVHCRGMRVGSSRRGVGGPFSRSRIMGCGRPLPHSVGAPPPAPPRSFLAERGEFDPATTASESHDTLGAPHPSPAVWGRGRRPLRGTSKRPSGERASPSKTGIGLASASAPHPQPETGKRSGGFGDAARRLNGVSASAPGSPAQNRRRARKLCCLC
jgi:hypothetical protein